MSGTHPQSVPELLAYLIFILRASQDFGGVAWITYNSAFRRQAFITGNRQWSRVNPSLYSICFAGAARTGMQCELCLSLCHPTRDCSLVSDPDPDVSSHLKTLESAVLAFMSFPQPTGMLSHPKSQDVCRSWNAGRCCMAQCRYCHACRVYGVRNTAFSCCDRSLITRPNPNWMPIRPLPPAGTLNLLAPPVQLPGNLFSRRPGLGPTDRGASPCQGSRPY